MKILHQVKANKPIGAKLAWIIGTVLQIEILGLFCSNSSMVILSDLFDVATDQQDLELIVILIFILNWIEILYFLFRFFATKKSENTPFSRFTLLSLVEIKPYLLFVQILYFNMEKIQTTQNHFILSAAIFNIIFSILEVIILQTISISYRFVEKNYIRRKNNSILPWILIIPIIFALQFYGSIQGSIFLLMRAFTQLYFNFNSLQNKQIRFYQWFFPLTSIQFAFLIFVDFYMNLSIFSNVITLTFTIIFTTYCCNNLSSYLLIKVLKYHLESCRHIMESESQENFQTHGSQNQIHESEMEKTLLKLRIMVKIHFSKIKHDGIFEENEELETENFDNWWSVFNRFIMNHRVYCQSVTCQCSKIEFMNQSENNQIEKRIFVEKIYAVIKKLQFESFVSTNKLKIIENYFLIEMQKKPLKTYYQLMKIEREKLNRQETLEIQSMILETRENFKQLFLKQKVRNTCLNIELLFEFQENLKSMRSKLNEIAAEYRHFYEMFANNFVQMQTLKQKTRQLTQLKKQFSHEIDFCLKKFSKSSELISFCIVYFRFFDEYTNKLEKIEERGYLLMETFKNPPNTIKRENVDIFDPQYGAVKVDLVFKVGQIVSITKNLCHFLGFKHRQLAGQKVNKLIPTIFAKCHDKFLRNFVEQGSLKMLKLKERVDCAKHMNQFLVRISLRLKVDYSHSDGFFAVGFIKPVNTKSEFILMDNYGKVEDITGGIYKRLLEKAFGNDISKVKRLCASKLILSLNYFLKDFDENRNDRDKVNEGLIITSQSENTLMSFYNYPGLMKIYKGNKEKESQTNRSSNDSQTTDQNGERTILLNLSKDSSNNDIDLKESMKSYFKAVNISNISGFRISYRLQDYVTNALKCKMLQIISFGQEIKGQELGRNLSQQIREVAEYMSIPQQQIQQFPMLKNPSATRRNSTVSSTSPISAYKYNDEPPTKSESKKFEEQSAQFLSDSNSSLRSDMEEKKKKQTVISSFEQQTHISVKLQFVFTALIFLMASILFVVIIFSLQMKGNYIQLQQDNMVLTNFRMYFSLRLTIQQMFHLYAAYGLPYPAYLTQKKFIIGSRIKTLLENSITSISISWDQYQKIVTLVDSTTGFTQIQSLFATMQIIYETFLMAKTTGHYIIDNYVALKQSITTLTHAEFAEILAQSNFYQLQIHLVIGAYSIILLSLLAVLIWIRKIALKREDKIIDLLPFLKASKARRNVIFYERFIEYNKCNESLDVAKIQEFALNSFGPTQILTPKQSLKSSLSKQQNQSYQQSSDSRLIRVIKNEKSGVTVKIILFCIFVSALCLFAIFYTQYFFYQAESKFSTYIQLKSLSNMVQLIPTRLILLYFINFNRILNNQTQTLMPQSFTSNAFNETFLFQTNISSPAYYGTQMQQIVRRQFNENICDLISCSVQSINSSIIQNQQLFYLSYRYETAFDYLRKIANMLPKEADPKGTMRRWIEENNVFELLNTIEYVLDLMETTENEISNLFTSQLVLIGYILLSLSLTLLPILMAAMIFGKRKFMEQTIQKVECSENVYKHISWPMLSQNTYALIYFENKLKHSKKY